MELRQLRYFCAVVDHANFTRAAAACAVAQPSLSQQIRSLEEELRQPLLVRHPRRVELTEAGRSILRHARTVLSTCETLRRGLERRSGLLEGRVVIGAIPTLAPFLLPEQIATFLRAHPAIRIRLRESRTPRLIEELVRGHLDLVIASDVTAADRKRWSLHVRELFREPLLLAVPQTHPLARQSGPVGIDQIPRAQVIVLSDGHCLGDQTLRVCRIRRSEDRIECGQLATLLAMVAAGLGVGIVPEVALGGHLPDGLAIRRLRSPEPERMISLVKRRSAALTPAAGAFLDHFRQTAPAAVGRRMSLPADRPDGAPTGEARRAGA